MLDQVGFIHIKLEKADNRQYQLIIPMNAPIGELFDVCFQLLQHVSEIAKQAADQAQAQVQQPQPAQPEVVNT
jgi:hypothetical protein